MFVPFKGVTEEHLTNLHLKRWSKFLWSTRDDCKCEISGFYGEYGDDWDVVLCGVVEIGQHIKS
jgi:hypothetical protein